MINLTTKQQKRFCLPIAGVILIAVILDNLYLRSTLKYNLYVPCKTLFWCFFAAAIYLLLPRTGQAGKLKYHAQFRLWAFNCALIYIGILILAGVLAGFGISPYDHSLPGGLSNVFSVGTTLASFEIIRNYIVNGFFRKEKYIAFLLVAFLMILPQLSLNNILQMSDWVDFSTWICEEFGPKYSQSILATYLCFLGGPIPSMIYLGIITAFHWFSPVLPDLPWLVTGLIGIMIPIFQMTFLSGSYLTLNKTIKVHKTPKESFIGWVATCMTTIMLLWFVVGVFPVYPSVIATGSMEPLIYPGDMILVEKITTIEEVKALQVGDIIQFRRDHMMICHRIDKIIDKEGVLYFVTKGDNNPSVDSTPVKVENIKGTIIKVIPKVGWPSLALKLVGHGSTDPVQF